MAGQDIQDSAAGAAAPELKRTLGPWQLMAVGIGAIIGAGIFVITGKAAADFAGPAIMISFVIAGFGCLFAGLCYAELAAMIPQSGSAYTYAYAAFGRFAAWIIGWDLLLEYGMSAGAVSVGWSGYLSSVMVKLGMPFPEALSQAPVGFDSAGHFVLTGAIVNLPAVAIVGVLTALLMVGMRTSASVNGFMVLLKLAVVLLVIIFGLPLINEANLVPFVPENTGNLGEYGWSGVLRGAAVVFFAYIGFDTVSAAAQEARNPQRDLPIGILGSLAICTILYILMSLTMVGLAHYSTLSVPNPVTIAIQAAGPSLTWLEWIVDVGAVAGLTTVILVSLYGQSRIFYVMARDGMLPKVFSVVHPTFNTPARGTLLIGIFAAFLGGVFPIDVLGELVSIGTLLAFVLVCLGVIVLRVQRPDVARPFRAPFSPITPVLGILVCGAMMALLPWDTWVRLGVWFAIGILIFALYGIRHAKQPAWTLWDDGPKK